MAFDPSSRYARLAVKTLDVTTASGDTRKIRYVERRFLPAPSATPALVEHRVIQGERLDQITARYLSDPLQFWQVADANVVLRPEELTEEPGRAIVLALPVRTG